MLKTTRKRGADMTNALLWSAFFMVVLISLFAIFQQVRFSQAKQEMSRVFMNVSAEIETWPRDIGSVHWNGRSIASRLHDLGAIEDSVYVEGSSAAGDGAQVPYGGLVTFSSDVGQHGALEAFVNFEGGGRKARALCYAMGGSEAADPATGVIASGPLGTNYMVQNYCDSEDPAMRVIMRVSDPQFVG